MKPLAIASILLYVACTTYPMPRTVAPMRIFEVRQVIAAENPTHAAEIACGEYHAEIVCEVVEVEP